jgi:hypothetical protein
MMAANVEGFSEQFKGFQLMMQQMLDKMSSFEAWRVTTASSLGSLLTNTTADQQLGEGPDPTTATATAATTATTTGRLDPETHQPQHGPVFLCFL